MKNLQMLALVALVSTGMAYGLGGVDVTTKIGPITTHTGDLKSVRPEALEGLYLPCVHGNDTFAGFLKIPAGTALGDLEAKHSFCRKHLNEPTAYYQADHSKSPEVGCSQCVLTTAQ